MHNTSTKRTHTHSHKQQHYNTRQAINNCLWHTSLSIAVLDSLFKWDHDGQPMLHLNLNMLIENFDLYFL